MFPRRVPAAMAVTSPATATRGSTSNMYGHGHGCRSGFGHSHLFALLLFRFNTQTPRSSTQYWLLTGLRRARQVWFRE